ncbi:MAG TPA: sortase [Patescibacteria group bacterium]|nr:sortase [Patescibacteria group bacterium]
MNNKKKQIFLISSGILVYLVINFIIGYSIFYKLHPKNPFQKTNKVNAEKNAESSLQIDEVAFQKFGLQIDKINVRVPVAGEADSNQPDLYQKLLKKGVVHYSGTPYPGKVGNIFIFGHSSSDFGGHYRQIFINLNDLQDDDTIKVVYKSREYEYKVIGKKIVQPDDFSVLGQTFEKRLTLMTCWPIGSLEKRLVIIAKIK